MSPVVADTSDPRPAPPIALPPPSAPGPAEATRERLLQAAHELLHERGGPPIAVSEICARAQSNVAMVKYCFGNKDGLMLALLTRITDSFGPPLRRLAALELPWREKLRRHVGEVVRNYMRYPYLNRLLTDRLRGADAAGNRALSESLAIPMATLHGELLAEARAAGELARPVDPTLFFFSVLGMCEFLFAAEPWLAHGFGRALDAPLAERYADHVAELVLNGLSGG